MLKQSFGKSFLLFQIITICSFSLLLGLATLKLPPQLVLGALAASVFLYAIRKRPEIALLGILFATSSIIFEDQLPIFPIGIGSLHIPDILLLGSLGFIVLRKLTESEYKFIHTPLDLPLLIFVGVTLVATIIAVLQSTVEIQTALRETRVQFYYLTFFVVTNLVRKQKQLNFLINGIIFLATIVALAMMIQLLLDVPASFLPGRVETLETQGVTFEGVTRILPPGLSIVLVSFVATLCALIIEKFKPLGFLKFLQCGLLGMAILLTFLRGYWAVLILLFFLLGFLFRGVEWQRLIGWGMVVLFGITITMMIILNNPDSRAMNLVGGAANRLSTLFRSETFQGQDDSFNLKKIENEYALSAILEHPFIGMGMGYTYRPWDPRIDQSGSNSNFDFRKFIHNGHFGVMLQSGLLGYFSLMWLSFAFLIRGYKYWQNITDDRISAVMLGFTLAYLLVLVAAVINSTFNQWYWTPIIGIIMGINEVILINFRKTSPLHN